jgi:hypothetical protein
MENYFFKDNMLNISVLGTGEGFQGSNPQSCLAHPWGIGGAFLSGDVRL